MNLSVPLAGDFQEFLSNCQLTSEWYIYLKVVSFSSSIEKANQRLSMLDTEGRDNFSDFIKACPRSKNVWVGIFGCPSENWVGKGVAEWDEIIQHVWLAIFVKDSEASNSQRHLMIWDCDRDFIGDEDAKNRRLQDVINGKQQSFVNYVKWERNLAGLWLGGRKVDLSAHYTLSTTVYLQGLLGEADGVIASEPGWIIQGFRRF